MFSINSPTNTNPETTSYTTRPYQRVAIDRTRHHTTALVQQSLEREDNPEFPTAALLEMATGSGKTFTVGKYLTDIIDLRNRFNRRYNTQEFAGLNILVLTNRIDGVNQFRDDLVHGKTGDTPKPPILRGEIIENLHLKTFHSQADNLEDLDETYFTQDESDEDEVFSKQNGRVKDNFFFSTFQTAILKDLAYKLPYIDLIIIDEAHNVKVDDEYTKLLQDLSELGRNDHAPMILAVTATPTNYTVDLFGEAIATFGLAEYIASEYAPAIDYHLVSATNTPAGAVQSILAKVESAKAMSDTQTKKQLVREIQDDFDAIMASYPSINELVHDLIHVRIGTDPDTIGQTIIFANGQDEADEIAEIINTQYGQEVAISYHSSNDSKTLVKQTGKKQTGLERFADQNDSIKIIVAIGKLNESVDVPSVENVVFWRGTDAARIFYQQFGRGLRGTGKVNYYDYIGGLKNFAWIGQIYEEYRDYIKSIEVGLEKPHKLRLIGNSMKGKDVKLDIHNLVFDITRLQKDVSTLLGSTQEEIIATFSIHGITNGDELQKKGVVWFQKTFGVKDLGTFLERRLLYISTTELQELCDKLGWTMKIKLSIGSTKEAIIATFSTHNITNGDELQKKGPVWFQKTFGAKELGEFLGRRLYNIRTTELQELCKKLNWTMKIEKRLEKPSLGTTKEDITVTLSNHSITNGDELQEKGRTWFQNTFGIRELGVFLGRKLLGRIIFTDLQELAGKLGWTMKIVEKPSLGTTKEAIIATLLTNGISNGDELQKKGVIWFRETFGKSELGVFLGGNLRHINLAELQELTEKLGWTMKIEEKVEKPSLGTTKEAIIATLLTHGITNGVELQKKGPVWFEKIFGRKDFNKFIGKTAQKTTLASLQELGEQLGWTVSKK